MTAGPDRFQRLARTLSALASSARLELLHTLRTPLELNEIRITGDDGRPLARQTIAHHLDTLMEAGLVLRISPDGRARGTIYVLNHPQMFVAVDDMRGLARLHAGLQAAAGSATMMATGGPQPRLPPRPRLAIAYGRDSGLAFALAAAPDATTIGRDAACDIVLDYDPYLSQRHARIEGDGAGGHALRDLGSRNGTLLNGEPARPDRPERLSAGDLITVGRTVLCYQP